METNVVLIVLGVVIVLELIAIIVLFRRVKFAKPINPADWRVAPAKDLLELKERLMRSLSRQSIRDSEWESGERSSLLWVLRQIDGERKEADAELQRTSLG